MRSIKAEIESTDFQRILKQAKSTQANLVVWQINDGKREILDSLLSVFNFEAGKLHFELKEDGKIRSELPLYCYGEQDQFIFKSKVQDIQGRKFCISIPNEIMLLDEPDVVHIRGTLGYSTNWVGRRYGSSAEDLGNDIIRVKSMSQRTSRDQDFLNQEFMSIEEEDAKFADMRESPRARPKNEKRVKILIKEINAPLEFRLFDLSRGGMGFIVDNEYLFTKGMEVQVMGFDDFSLDDPLVGNVMGVRPIDETRKEFKIGVKFLEGQN